MRKITRIFVHCTASRQDISLAQLQSVFKAKKWKNPGYHYVVFPDGKVVQMLSESSIANGVRGYNSRSIHVAYTGGIDAQGKAVDNRTLKQRAALRVLLQSIHRRYPEAVILGHRDISPDKNKNGKVDSWERIKECPCFDAIPEFKDI